MYGSYRTVIIARALSVLLQSDTGVLSPNGYPTGSGRKSAAPGLYFCGFTNKATGLLREIGIEARRIAQSIAASSSSHTRNRHERQDT